MANAGVFLLRDRVDKEVMRQLGEEVEIKIDSPGGCCVDGPGCEGRLDVGNLDVGNFSGDLDSCKVKSCAPVGWLQDSDRCNHDYFAENGRADDAIRELNRDLASEAGVDWGRSEYVEKATMRELEAFLEGCLHPMKDGTCMGSSPTLTRTWL